MGTERNEVQEGSKGRSIGQAAGVGGRRRRRATSRPRLALGTRGVSQLRWLARVGWAEARQMQARFGGDLKWTRERLRQLERAGLLRSQPLSVVTRAHAYLVTTAGIETVGSPLTAPSRDVGPAVEVHDWCVTTLTALLGAEGIRTTTVREMIAAHREGEIRLPRGFDPRGKPRVHYPDLLVELEGRTVAVEIERSPKALSRLSQILVLYRGCPGIDQVLYLGEERITRRVMRQASRLGMGEVVEVGPMGEATIEAWTTLVPQVVGRARIASTVGYPRTGVHAPRGE